MSSPDSVTEWIQGARVGDESAFQKIWERYYAQLVRLARRRLANAPRRAADEEDIAASAFSRFFRLIVQGRFPESADRDDLWRLLMAITAGKVVDYVRAETSLKRGGGQVRGESAFEVQDADSNPFRGIEQIVGDEPTPEFALEVAEQLRSQMDLLADDKLKSIALRKLEGYSNAEIAEQNEYTLGKVEHSLKLIRAKWKQERA
jgi:RNA polymerase sigma factor (sigma-70 family)